MVSTRIALRELGSRNLTARRRLALKPSYILTGIPTCRTKVLCLVCVAIAMAGCKPGPPAGDELLNADGTTVTDAQETSAAGSGNRAAGMPTATLVPGVSATDPTKPGLMYALAADPTTPDRLYFTWDRGLLASADGGQAWTLLPQSKAPGETRVHHVTVDDTGRLWLGGAGTLRHSADGGESWQEAGELGSGEIIGLTSRGNDVLALVERRGILATDDEGATWRKVGEAPRAYGLWSTDDGGLLTIDVQGAALVFTSDDGESWTTLPARGLAGIPFDLATEPDILVAGSEGLFRSTDGGHSFARVGPFAIATGVTTLPHEPSTLIVVIPGGNVYRSTDGGSTWPGLEAEGGGDE